jgi:hypothetical protein
MPGNDACGFIYRSEQTIGWLGFEAILNLDFDFDCTDDWEWAMRRAPTAQVSIALRATNIRSWLPLSQGSGDYEDSRLGVAALARHPGSSWVSRAARSRRRCGWQSCYRCVGARARGNPRSIRLSARAGLP